MFVGVGVTEAEMSFMFGHFTFNMIELNIPCKPEASRRDIKVGAYIWASPTSRGSNCSLGLKPKKGGGVIKEENKKERTCSLFDLPLFSK